MKKNNSLSNPTVQLALSTILFVFVILLSRSKQLSDLEMHVFMNFYSMPAYLFGLFYLITQFGSVYMLAGLPTIFFVKKEINKAMRFLITGCFAYASAGVAKDLWGRGRPVEFISSVNVLDVVHGPGFPSGHVALATALALTFGHYLPKKYSFVPAIWIVLVGISRMYLGVHLPLDILGGFALGWIVYASMRHIRLLPARDMASNTPKTSKK